jgi:hypothetical protein
MLLIQRWHRHNVATYPDELEHLLRVARHDNVHVVE